MNEELDNKRYNNICKWFALFERSYKYIYWILVAILLVNIASCATTCAILNSTFMLKING